MGEFAKVDLEAVHRLAGDLRIYRERAAKSRAVVRSSAAEVESFLDDVVSVRTRAVENVRTESSRLGGYVPYDAESRKNYDRILNDAEGSLQRAVRVRSRVREVLTEVERAAGAHSGAVDRGIVSALRTLGLAASDLAQYLGNGSAAPTSRSSPVTVTNRASYSGLPNGFEMVSVSEIDDSDSQIHGPEDFAKGYSIGDLEWAFNALLDVVLPTLDAGGTIDDLRVRDTIEGRAGTRSYADTYSGFFGDGSAIVLDCLPEGWTVTNGYHRIWVARRMGLTSIPVRRTKRGT